ncbi:MAG TPA: hypothetical protein VEC60_12330, partial [Reyranella sp.]|nr:hypothetical protein [Reyranella sp.]
MGVRFFVAALLAVLLSGVAEARDCITVRQDDVAIVKDSGCGDLRLMSRKRDDPRPNIDIGATWIEFAVPAGPGEWRYNDWVGRQVATLNLDKPIKLAPEGRSEDRVTVESLYRSDALISARYSRRMCCGVGSTVYGSINVDLRRWTLVSPDDLVSLGAAANVCWRQFADDGRHGEAFAAAWPLERPWVDRDFEHHRIGHRMRELIGPVVIDPK